MKSAINAGKTADERARDKGAGGKGEKANAAANAARVRGMEQKLVDF